MPNAAPTCASRSKPFNASSAKGTMASTSNGINSAVALRRQSRRRAVADQAERELKRLAYIPPASPEYSVIVSYVETLAELAMVHHHHGQPRFAPGPGNP